MYVPPMLAQLWGRSLRLIRDLHGPAATEYHLLPMTSPRTSRTWLQTVTELHARLWRARARVERGNETIEALRRENELLQQRASRYKKEARAERRAAEELQAALDEERKANKVLRRELDAQSKLLHVRGVELREAEAYSATVDAISHTDVVRVLDALNAEIFQFAAQAADGIQVHNVKPRGDVVRAVEEAIGHDMVRVLRAVARGRCEPIGVQIALQAVLAQLASWAVSSWALDPGQNAALQGIYDDIFAAESQGVSAKWKALTRRHSTRFQLQKEGMQDHFIRAASYVLQVAGGGVENVPEPLAGSLRGKADEIARLSAQLRTCIGEEVASSDFRVIAPRAGEEFDGVTMDDTNASGGGPSVGRVLGTTGLGLLRREKMKKSGEQAGGASTVVVKTASVMLDDVTKELLGH